MVLSKEEKIQVIEQHSKNLEFNMYNLTLSILEESSIENKDQEAIDSLQSQLSNVNAKISALQSELTKVKAE